MDAGKALVEHLYREMQIDDEWAVKEDRGFTWWGGSLAQRVWADDPVDDLDVEVCRVHARTAVLTNIPDTEKFAEIVAMTAAFSTMSAPLIIGRDLYSAASVIVHDGTLEMWQRLVSIGVVIQAASAHIEAEALAKLTECEVALTGHPESGVREVPDDMLNIIEAAIAPTGQETSRFEGPDFEAAEQAVGQQVSVLTSASPTGLTSEFAFGEETALFQMQTDTPNPRLRNGLLSTLTLPVNFPHADVQATALELNKRDLLKFNRAQSVGSWCPHPSLKGNVSYVTFWPNACAMPGLATTLLMYAASKAKWAYETIQGGWPEHPSAEEPVPAIQRLFESVVSDD